MVAVEKHLGIYDADTYLSKPSLFYSDAQEIIEKIHRLLPSNGKVWIIGSPIAINVNKYLYNRLDNFILSSELFLQKARIFCFKFRNTKI